jgi:hypothetical protein
MFDDYHVVSDRLANQMTDEELTAICEDLPERLAHIRRLLGPDERLNLAAHARIKVLGRARDSGTFETPEGPVHFDEGAYFSADSKGRIWPVDANTFERDYKLVK